MKRLLIVLVVCAVCFGLRAQVLVTYPVPENIPQNNDFSVKVRLQNGVWTDLYEYEVEVDGHNIQKSSMVNFDFEGSVEVAVTCNREEIKSARIRPASFNIPHKIQGNIITFSLTKPVDISVEVNGDIFHNLHIFTNSPETYKPSPNDSSVIYYGPGFHTIKNDTLNIPSHKTLYLAGGAVLNATIFCNNVQDVRVCGRGILYNPLKGVGVNYSQNIQIEDLIFINPTYYTVCCGQSSDIKIKNIRSFSARPWSDGIDFLSCKDIQIDGVFLRNSDDCLAFYGHRWNFYGDCKNVSVQNSTLWADVAHPINIGTHGNPEQGKFEILENMVFKNIDILNHDEPQIDYQGCMAINVSDQNLVRNISFENIRIEDFEQGQLFNLRVTFNKKYATAPGRGIENIYFKDITYSGKNAGISIIEGYSQERSVKNIVFENLIINGKEISNRMAKPGHMKYSDFAKIYEGLFVSEVKYLSSGNDLKIVQNSK